MCKVEAHSSGIIWVEKPASKVVNFLLESTLNSLNLDLVKMCKPCNSFLPKVRERQGT